MPDVIARPAATGGRRASTVFLGLIALAAVGYGIAKWTAGGERPAAAEPSGSAISRDSAPDRSTERGPSGIPTDLELVGVVVGGADHAGTAIITGHGGPQKSYRIGDPVRAGVVLKEVLPDGAVLAAGDARQHLSLKKGTSSANPMLSDGRSDAVPVGPQATATEPVPGGVRGSSSWARPNTTPETLAQSLYVPDPNGEFRLESVKPGSVYAKSGFQAGDVVRSVNGQAVESPDQLMVLHKQLIEGRQGEVEMLREGQSETLRYGGS